MNIKKLRQLIMASLAVIILAASSLPAYADQYDDQINALQQQVNQQQQKAASYGALAADYQARVNQLQAQISALQGQIELNQLKADQLQQQIVANEQKLAEQKAILGANIKQMYLDSSTSSLEVLVSSNSLSDFFDKQQYQDKVKQKIQDTMAAVAELQKQLVSQRDQVNATIALQETQRQQLANSQAEANQLLAAAAESAASANAQVRANNSQISSLRAQQAAVLASRFGSSRSGGACGGGYPGSAAGPWGPWGCNYPQDNAPDNWGMFNRECVSYTAFRVAASGRRMPYWGGSGNANQWPSNARADGIPVDGSPRVGDVAISMLGSFGHAMYVEAVHGGTISVSQYNYGNNGEYSTMTISAGGLQFIHF